MWTETEREKSRVTLSKIFWSQETGRTESSLIGKKTREKVDLRLMERKIRTSMMDMLTGNKWPGSGVQGQALLRL